MSSLRESVVEQTLLKPPVLCVEKDHQSVSMIMFCPWGEAITLLPWSRLDAIRHVNEDAVERLELSFSHHRIIAVGENLRQTLEWLRTSKVLCLRSMPAAHRASLRPTEPFISQLEVQALADLKNQPVGEVPF